LLFREESRRDALAVGEALLKLICCRINQLAVLSLDPPMLSTRTWCSLGCETRFAAAEDVIQRLGGDVAVAARGMRMILPLRGE
jgi:hypothetical protein